MREEFHYYKLSKCPRLSLCPVSPPTPCCLTVLPSRLLAIVSHADVLIIFLSLSLSFFPSHSSVQTQSPVLQSKMLVPMATVRTGSTPPHPSISLGAPPLPVQNSSVTGNKVGMSAGTKASARSSNRRCSVC